MANNLKVFDTIQEYESATIPSNAVSYIKEDNSIRYSGGIETSMQAPITGIKVNGDVVNIDSDGKIDIGSVQETLVSGSNIKTINGFSVLGYGNIDISTNGTIDLSGYATKEELSSVATSGDYNDLSNKPDNVVESTVSGWGFTKNPGTITSVSANGTTIASNGAANIPAATTSKYGVTKLSSSTNSTSTTLAATSSAVKLAYDLASSKQDVISDLDEIRNKANLGSTAIQSVKTINGQSIVGTGDLVIEGGETLTEADITAMGFTKNAGTITGVSANGTSVATSGVANIPAASTSKYGVTKLSSATNSTSTSLAATASAVKAAYDLAKGKVSESDIFENKTDGIIKAEALYNDKSQGGLIYALPTSRLALEDSCDDVLVVRSEIFACSPEQSMLQADAFYETTTGTIYGLPTSSIVTNGGEDEIIATQSYVDNAVANAGGGGGSSSGSGAYAEVNHGTSNTTFTLTPNVFHIWDEVENLTLTLGPEASGVANEFLFQFNSGSTATTLSLPDTLKWANDSAPTIEANKIYQISILKGLASVLVFNNTPPAVIITFTIAGTEYQAEEGMTWAGFVNSVYNTSNIRVQSPYIMTMVGEIIGTSSSNYVSQTDVIIGNTDYVAIYPM